MPAVETYCGRVEDVLPKLPSNWADAGLTDPPYGILDVVGWDHDAPPAPIWAALRRVLKPGAPVLAFGGRQTCHRLATAMERAGLEICDMLMWLYGQGFPKSADMSLLIDRSKGRPPRGQQFSVIPGSGSLPRKPALGRYEPQTKEAVPWAGYRTTLKPDYEPILLARTAFDKKLTQNVLKWGCGALNVGQCRATGGRHPGSIILDEQAAQMLDAANKKTKSSPRTRYNRAGSAASTPYGKFGPADSYGYGDEGGPSRFFYCAKPSRAERQAGLSVENTHSTVKPLALTRHLARLILPPPRSTPRRLLVPYCGVFSEIIGAIQVGWEEVIGIEINQKFIEMGKTRLIHFCKSVGEGAGDEPAAPKSPVREALEEMFGMADRPEVKP